jgi:hypothetical protein
MPLPVIGYLLAGVFLLALSYALTPKPKQPKPPSLEDLNDPTADAGRALPVGFGSIDYVGLNILYYGQKDINVREVSTGGKK